MSIITLDFETYYSKTYSLSKITTEDYIRSPEFQVIGFAYAVDGAMPVWITGSDEQIARSLHDLDLPNHQLLCHHAAFDGAILGWRYGIYPKLYLDTKSMAKPITGHTKVGASLAKLATHFNLGRKGTEVVQALGKRREDFNYADLHQYGEYCKNDVALTRDLFQTLYPSTTKKELYIIDLMIRMFTDPVLYFNKPLLESHLAEVQAKKEAFMAKLDAAISREDLMSNPKLASVLQKLGVEPPVKISPTTGKEAWAFAKTDQDFKDLLEHPDVRVQAVISARLGVKSTLEETRTESFIGISERGALPVMLNYYGAATGRASGGDGMNFQNLPRGPLREAIRPPEGHKLVAADSSQIEARVLAWMAGQDDLVEAFANKEDVYKRMASVIYGKPVEEIDKAERTVGKVATLGAGYGMGHARFKDYLKTSTGITVDLDEAKKIIQAYRSMNSKIVKLWKDGEKVLDAIIDGTPYEFGRAKLLCDRRGIQLPNDMWLLYPDLRKDMEEQYTYEGKYGRTKIYGAAIIENVVQALARIIVFDQMCAMDSELRKRDSRFIGTRYRTVLSVHDETVLVVPEEDAEWALKLLMAKMSTPPKWGEGLPITCEGGIGAHYADVK